MKTLRVLAIAAAVLTANSAMAADQVVVTDEGVGTFSFFKPASVRAEVGTTGIGGAVSYGINPNWGVTLGYAQLDEEFEDVQLGDTDFDVQFDVQNAFVTATYRPFGGNFGIDFGTYVQDNNLGASIRPDAGTQFDVDGQTFTAGANTSVVGKISYRNEVAPFLGLSYSPSITQRFGFFGQVGVLWNGETRADLNANGTVNNPTTGLVDPVATAAFQQAVADAEREVKGDAQYEFLPVAKVGLAVRF
ncbi:MAG: hypothetical protein WA154_00385 [Moraxellaceae bacterium]